MHQSNSSASPGLSGGSGSHILSGCLEPDLCPQQPGQMQPCEAVAVAHTESVPQPSPPPYWEHTNPYASHKDPLVQETSSLRTYLGFGPAWCTYTGVGKEGERRGRGSFPPSLPCSCFSLLLAHSCVCTPVHAHTSVPAHVEVGG